MGVSESKGMHAHPLLKHIPVQGTMEDVQIQNLESRPPCEPADSQPQPQRSQSQLPCVDSPDILLKKDLAD